MEVDLTYFFIIIIIYLRTLSVGNDKKRNLRPMHTSNVENGAVLEFTRFTFAMIHVKIYSIMLIFITHLLTFVNYVDVHR